MSDLLSTLQSDLKAALKGGDRTRVATIRFLISQMQYVRIEKGADLDDADVLGVLAKQAKSRKESIQAFETGGRSDLVAKEQAELAILEEYLPAQMDEEAVRDVVAGIVSKEGMTGRGDMGRLMKAAMAELQGRAEGGTVSRIAQELLEQGPA
jgi:hypothetical protein